MGSDARICSNPDTRNPRFSVMPGQQFLVKALLLKLKNYSIHLRSMRVRKGIGVKQGVRWAGITWRRREDVTVLRGL
eukprot:5486035-Pyramimonas_sp.AAC.1